MSPSVHSSASIILSYFFLNLFLPSSNPLKCLDCVGENCMGSFCDGEYCMLSRYAPRWGTLEWGEPRVIKGCLSGSLVKKGIRNHCETVGETAGEEAFTCFCNQKDNCNGDKAVERLEVEPVQLLTCVCEGAHCKSPTCLGELCSYVVNHNTNQVEQGCVNASVPLIERRSAGACMIPPITGAMHHTVAKNAEDLLVTESCICGSDYCNMEKPEPTVEEKMKCRAFVKVNVIGTKMESKEVSCTGEFCFKAKIVSKIGHMSEYNTIGCASFVDGAELAEELNPIGCAKFNSENVVVEACMTTTDKRAIGRARANQQIPERSGSRPKPGKSPKMEVSFDNEEGAAEEENGESLEEEEESGKKEQKPTTKPSEDKQQHYIFERPTLAPEVEENSNTALVSVFLLIILLIVLSGVVWKLQLHKRLFRANYDSVAGG